MHSQPSSPHTPTPQELAASTSGISPSTLTPPSKRQKILESPKSLTRDVLAKKQAEDRDNFCCVLTGIELTEVHIFSRTMPSNTKNKIFTGQGIGFGDI